MFGKWAACTERAAQGKDFESELHAGRADPRVGSGQVGSGRVRKFTNMSGSGRVQFDE